MEVLAVRYGTLETSSSAVYLNWPVYGEPDRPVRMDYYFWVLRTPSGTTLVDCGFDPEVGARRGREVLVDPVDALRALGVGTPDRIVVSHAHYDHVGNLARLPDVELVMSRRELEFWLGPHAGRPQFAHSVESPEIAEIARAHAEGRVTVFDGSYAPGPDVELLEVGGHSPGQLVATVAVPGGEAVLASDAVHFYDEVATDRPFFVVADLEAMYAGYDTVRALSSRPGRVLVAGHDADVPRRFPGRASGTGIDELVVTIDAHQEE